MKKVHTADYRPAFDGELDTKIERHLKENGEEYFVLSHTWDKKFKTLEEAQIYSESFHTVMDCGDIYYTIDSTEKE